MIPPQNSKIIQYFGTNMLLLILQTASLHRKPQDMLRNWQLKLYNVAQHVNETSFTEGNTELKFQEKESEPGSALTQRYLCLVKDVEAAGERAHTWFNRKRLLFGN